MAGELVVAVTMACDVQLRAIAPEASIPHRQRSELAPFGVVTP